jgi:hypothetical protein
MLFMVTSTWDPSRANDAINKRLEMEKKGDALPSGVKLLGEWGYLGGARPSGSSMSMTRLCSWGSVCSGPT